MPRTKRLDSYPTQYWTIIEECALRGKRFDLPVANWREAAQIQGRFYAFRQAIVREFQRISAKNPLDADFSQAEFNRVKDQLAWCDQTVCYYDRKAEDVLHVSFMARDKTPMAEKLQAALDKAGVKEPTQDGSDMAQRILDKVKGKQ